MSDYSETFTKVDGNTIEAADFETEFQAIETAIATKYDSDDLLDEDNMASDSAVKFPSQQSVKAYVDTTVAATPKLIFLDTPQLLVNTSSDSGGFVTLDMSVVYAAAATAGAIKAVLSVSAFVSSGTSLRGIVYIRKTGSALAANAATKRVDAIQAVSSGADYAHNECIVNLDGNSDFDYYYNLTGSAGINQMDIYLTGYYV